MIKLWFDGACEPNPNGKIGYGYVVQENNNIVREYGNRYQEKGKPTSNNMAEYISLIAGLRWLIYTQRYDQEIECFGDSQLVINQMKKGEDIISDGIYAHWGQLCIDLLKFFPHIKFTWIPRVENLKADKLSRKALK